MVKIKNTEFKKYKNVINYGNNKWFKNKNVNKKEVHKKNDSDMRNNEVYNCKKCGNKHKPRECYAFGKMCGICKKMNRRSIITLHTKRLLTPVVSSSDILIGQSGIYK